MFIVIIADEADLASASDLARFLTTKGLPATPYTEASRYEPDVSLADAVVVICSATSLQSVWLQRHAQGADELGKPLVLVALRGIDPAELGGAEFAWIDDREGVVMRIKATVGLAIGSADDSTHDRFTAPVAAPAAPPAPTSLAQATPSIAILAAAAERTITPSVPPPVAMPTPMAMPELVPKPMSAEPRPAPFMPAPAPVLAAPMGGVPQASPVQAPGASATPAPRAGGAGALSIDTLKQMRGKPGVAWEDELRERAAADATAAKAPWIEEVAGIDWRKSVASSSAPPPSSSSPFPSAPPASSLPSAPPGAPVLQRLEFPGVERERRRPLGDPPAAPREMPSMGAPPRSGSRGLVAGVAVLIAAGGLAFVFRDRLGEVAQVLSKHADKLLAVLGLSKGAVPPMPASGGVLQSQSDLVDCSVFAPPTVTTGARFMVQVFLHLVEHEERVAFLAAAMDESARIRGRQTLQVPVIRGSRVRIEIDGQGVGVEEPIQDLMWRGEPNVAAFSCMVPADMAGQSVHPVVRIFVDDFPVGRVLFQVKADAAQQRAAPVATPELTGQEARRYRYAFLSYASEDRAEVLKRAQALQVANIGFFQDLLSLGPGERYERKIYEKIGEADLFMLFWSRNARASQWVNAEIDFARACQAKNPKSLPDIVPVVLEDPRDAPPPERLGDRHFNDTIAALISYEERRPRGTGGFLSRWFGRG